MTLRRKLQTRGTAIAVLMVLLVFWFVPPVWKLEGGYTTVTQWQRSIGAKTVEVGPEKPNWIAANAVSKNVLYAFVAAEDARFFLHGGLDIYEIFNSVEQNWSQGRYARGASTITQQVVKMAFLSRDKSLIRKMREAVGAVCLEWILDKNEILEWYLNLAEFGDGIYGLRAAAQHYFQTKPELLTIQQATHLALVLPSPNGWSVGLRRRNLTDFGHRRFAYIVTQMKLSGYITETQWLNALATGNFGRPLYSYERIIARVRRRENISSGRDSEELPFTDAETPLEEELFPEESITPDAEELLPEQDTDADVDTDAEDQEDEPEETSPD